MGVTMTGSLMSKVAGQEVLPPDEVDKIVAKLKDQESAALTIEKLNRDHTWNRLAVAAILVKMRENSWNCGHAGFDDLCEKRFNLGRHTANYYIRVYKWVSEAGLGAEDIQVLGFSKLRALA